MLHKQSITLINFCALVIIIGTGISHFTATQPYPYLMETSLPISYLIGSILLLLGILMCSRYFPTDQGRIRAIFFAAPLLLLLNSTAALVKSGYVAE